MSEVLVIGHRNPDTDSICSAIGYAEFKRKIDLIYIDPPFDVGADFSMSVPIGDEQETAEKTRISRLVSRH